MTEQDHAAKDHAVILNVLGMLRWATPSDMGGWDVESTCQGGRQSMAHHTRLGVVVWDVAAMGGYPDEKEFSGLKNRVACQYRWGSAG